MESNADVIHAHDRDKDSYLVSPRAAISDAAYPSDSMRTYMKDADDDVEQSIPCDTLVTPLECHPGIPSGLSHNTPLLISVWKWVLVFLVPTISLLYLAFCYVVHYRVVPASLLGLSADTTQLLTNLGAGITTFNILIISLALFPLKGLLNDLQSEEFFRLLSAEKSRGGVKLAAINGISSPSFSLLDSIMVIVCRHCSSCYVMAFSAAIIFWAISILAPAALSTQPIIVDGPIMAFSVGAIPPLSLYQPVAGGQIVQPSLFSPAPGYSAAIVWAEREISLSFSYSVLNDSQGTYAGFVAPTPPLLNSTTNARWLTDVIGLNPYCTWANPVNITPTSLNFTMNSTDVPDTAVSVHLQDVDLQVSVPSSYFPVYNSFFVTSINVHDPTVTLLNYTTGSLPTDGAMVMSVVQCASTNCTKEVINIVALFVDFTNIPSMSFSSIGANYELGFLVCKPNMTIETREVRTQGSMMLEVRPLPESPSTSVGGAASPSASRYPRQGNLDWTQTSLLTSYSLSRLTTDSGPSSSAWNGLGSGTQVDFVFGHDQMKSVPTGPVYENTSMMLRPLSPDQLAEGYTQMVKASMKPYVSGLLGTSYVPGRLASVEQIFVSSLPHVVASTILFLVLFAIAVAVHFRYRKGEQFTLTNIAAALADSAVDISEGSGIGTGMGLATVVKKAKVGVIVEREEREREHKRSGRNAGHPGKPRQGCWWVTTPWTGHRDSEVDVGLEVARRLGDYKVYLEHPAEADGLEVLWMNNPDPNSGNVHCKKGANAP